MYSTTPRAFYRPAQDAAHVGGGGVVWWDGGMVSSLEGGYRTVV